MVRNLTTFSNNTNQYGMTKNTEQSVEPDGTYDGKSEVLQLHKPLYFMDKPKNTNGQAIQSFEAIVARQVILEMIFHLRSYKER